MTTALTVGLCTAGELWGGVELAVLLLARGLPRHGIAPVAILFHEGQLAQALRLDNVPVVVVKAAHIYSTANVREVTSAIRSYAVGLLHTHGYKGTIWGGIAGASANVPVIKTMHGRVERPGHPRELAGWLRLLLYQQIERAVTRASVRTTVAVSDDLASASPKPAVVRIYNGVPLVGPSARERGRTFNIGIVGRLTAVKGHRVLFMALHRLSSPDVVLHVFGTGPLETECVQLASELGIADRVIFHGFYPDVQSRLGMLDALVMPSFSEGLPFALLEGMARGVPVIASNVGGIPEVVEDGVSGVLVKPGDAPELARAIAHLRDDPAFAASLAAGGLARIRDRFDAEEMIRRHVMLYRSTVGADQDVAS